MEKITMGTCPQSKRKFYVLGIPCSIPIGHGLGKTPNITKHVLVQYRHKEVAERLGFTPTELEVMGEILMSPPVGTYRIKVVSYGTPELDGTVVIHRDKNSPQKYIEEVRKALQEAPQIGDFVKFLPGAYDWLMENPEYWEYSGGIKNINEMGGRVSSFPSGGLTKIALSNTFINSFEDLMACIILPKELYEIIF